jgi:dihydrofolate reductase
VRRIVLFTNISLDRFISGPNDSIDWVIADQQLHETVTQLLLTADVVVYGRKTYQIMVDSWPTVPNDPSTPTYMTAFANTLNPMKKIVFSKTLQKAKWNTEVVKEFNPEEIKRMKEQPGRKIVLGGASIAQQFMQHGLIDEFQLLVHPVVLGSGKPFFANLKDRMILKLVSTTTFRSGAVLLVYQPQRKQ